MTRNMRSCGCGEAPIRPVETLHSGCAGDKHPMSETNEKAALNHAHHTADALLQVSGIGDGTKAAVQDAIAAVGDEILAGGSTAKTDRGTEALQRHLRCFQAKGDDLNRYRRARAELIHQLGSVHDDHEPAARRSDDLFVQERTAESLDQIERATLHLVRTVDREVDLPMLGE